MQHKLGQDIGIWQVLYKSYVICCINYGVRGELLLSEMQGLLEIEFIWRPTEKDLLPPKHITSVICISFYSILKSDVANKLCVGHV